MTGFRMLYTKLFLFLSVSSAMSQDKPSRFLSLYEIHVKPGQNAQWESYIKKIVEAADKTNALQNWMAFQAVNGSPGGTYYIAIPFEKWGDMDGWTQVPQMLAQAFGEAEAERLLQAGGAASEGFVLEAYSLLEDFTTHFDAGRYASNYYRVIRTQVKPEMDPTHRSLLARGSAVEKSHANAPMTIRRSNVLGTNFRYLASTPFNSWADIDAMEGLGNMLEEATGEAAAREFYETLRKCIVQREMLVITLRRDLSKLPH